MKSMKSKFSGCMDMAGVRGLRKMTLSLICVGLISPAVHAADDKELAQIRDEIRQMRAAYEQRLQSLEAKLAQAQADNQKLQAQMASAPAAAPAPAVAESRTAQGKRAGDSAFNPAIALNLSGTYTNLSQDPESRVVQGFMPTGGEVGPGSRGFSLGESELTLSANVDPHFFGQLTFALPGEGGAEVEEAFIQTRDLNHGLKIKGGRFLSGIAYMNGQHAHAQDFVDLPLSYQTFFGGQYKREGVQMTWLAPLNQYLEIGAEVGNGGSFPSTPRNKNGFADSALFARIGDDIGSGGSWRLGVSWLRDKAHERSYEDSNAAGVATQNVLNGKVRTWIVDGVFKWAPQGNATQTNFKLAAEYFRRTVDGNLAYVPASGDPLDGTYSSRQSGWHVQGVYQFRPAWRFGLRHERLHAGTQHLGLIDSGALSADDFPLLTSFNPRKTSLMLDYSPSEFSRLRLQWAREQVQPGRTDNQIFLQYNMSLGAHSAHAF